MLLTLSQQERTRVAAGYTLCSIFSCQNFFRLKKDIYTLMEDIQVKCDGYDEVQQEATHPLVYYTLKEYNNDGVYSAVCFYCGKKWSSKKED